MEKMDVNDLETTWIEPDQIPVPKEEEQRLEALAKYGDLQEVVQREKAFDRLANLAASICDVPVAYVNIIGTDTLYHKACFGIVGETSPRKISFCQFAIMEDDMFEIEDATKDPMFKNNPFVTGSFNLQFYAGIPLTTPDGYKIGTLCLIDHEPNKLTKSERQAMKVLADEIVSQFELNAARAKLLRLNDEKDELIKIVSHDMRNPLTGIIGFAELLQEEITNKEHQEILSIIENSGESILGIVNVLLNSEYIRNESLTISKKPHDIAELTRDVITLHEPHIRLKKITLNRELPEECTAKVDGEKWKQIVGNLLSNATKFTPEGGTISLSLSKEKSDDGKPYITFVIEDSGVGMDKKTQKNLFSGKDTIRRKGTNNEASTGVGMILIQKHVNLHLGSIEVDSKKNRGTTITVKLPA